MYLHLQLKRFYSGPVLIVLYRTKKIFIIILNNINEYSKLFFTEKISEVKMNFNNKLIIYQCHYKV